MDRNDGRGMAQGQERRDGRTNRQRTWPLVALTMAIVLYGNVINLMPQRIHDVIYMPLNCAVGVSLGVLTCGWLNLSRAQLGATVPRHAVVRGGAAGLIMAVPLCFVLFVPAATELLSGDDKMQRIGPVDFLYHAMVRIPLGTALFEEWLFRGVLYAAWLYAVNSTTALWIPSAAFGLWHIVPSFEQLQDSQPGAPFALALLFVTLSVVVTGIAGVIFTLLRRRFGDSIIAPAITHALINSGTLFAAWLVAKP